MINGVSWSVNYAVRFQGELGKVSWPGKKELYTSTIVVVVTMFFLGGLLLVFDLTWLWVMKAIGVLR